MSESLFIFSHYSRPRIQHELHGFTYLIEILDLSLQNAEETGKALPDADVDLCCEVLKILFNITLQLDKNNLDEVSSSTQSTMTSALSAKSTKLRTARNDDLFIFGLRLFQEEEAHFMRLVSILHDLLVCKTAQKDKKHELIRSVCLVRFHSLSIRVLQPHRQPAHQHAERELRGVVDAPH